MCGSMVDIQSVAAGDRRRKKEERQKEETTACPRKKHPPKYNGVVFEILGKHH